MKLYLTYYLFTVTIWGVWSAKIPNETQSPRHITFVRPPSQDGGDDGDDDYYPPNRPPPGYYPPYPYPQECNCPPGNFELQINLVILENNIQFL